MSKSRAMKRTMRRKSARRKTMRQKTMRRKNMRKTMRRNNMRKTMRRKNMRNKTMRRKYKRGGGLGERMRIGRYLADVLDYIIKNDVSLTRKITRTSFYHDATKALMNGDIAYVEFLDFLVDSRSPTAMQDINNILRLKDRFKKEQGEFKKDSRLKGLFKGATGYLSPKLRGLSPKLSGVKDYLSPKLKRAKEVVGWRSNTPASSSPPLNKEELIPELKDAIDNLGVPHQNPAFSGPGS